MDIKALKLSGPMETMIKGAALHSIRVDGIVIKAGLIVAGRSGTLVALIDRDLVTTSDAGNYGMNWLTDEGLKVYAELTGGTYMPREVPGFPVPDTMTHVVTDPTVTVADVLPVQHREMEAWLREHPVSEDHPTESDMITDVERQAHAETMAQSAAVQHYRNATSEDVSISAYDSPQYRASKELMMLTGTTAYPDLTGEEVYELIHSFNEGESLRDLVDIFRVDRDKSRADLDLFDPELREEMISERAFCDDCRGDHDTIVPCPIHRDVVAFVEHGQAVEVKRQQVEAWLLRYAWAGTDEQKAVTVACIMAQDHWKNIDIVAELFEAAQSGDDGEEGEPRITGDEFALSSLYECHEGPHIDGCADNGEPSGFEVDYSTNELPGDAERAWDAENAAMEAASIRAEYEGEFDDDDDVMVKTPRTFVSMNYLNTMRRIHADRAISRDKWKAGQLNIIADVPNLFALIDAVYAEGKITFGAADKGKRRIRNITRPTLGSKRKPSKSRRNRH